MYKHQDKKGKSCDWLVGVLFNEQVFSHTKNILYLTQTLMELDGMSIINHVKSSPSG